MPSRKAGIPAVRNSDPNTYAVLQALKENVERITGMRGGSIAELSVSAGTVEIVRKLNEVIARLNAQ